MSDAALFALVLENNRLLKALTERLAPKPEPESKQPDRVGRPVASGEWVAVLDGVAQTGTVIYGTLPPEKKAAVYTDKHGRLAISRRDLHRDMGSSKPLTESDMAHALKTWSLPELDLTLGGAAQALVDKTLNDLRNVALDEAAEVCDSRAKAYADLVRRTEGESVQHDYESMRKEAVATAKEVRALKSKPAPQPSGISGELPQDKWTCGGCGESGTGFMPGRHEMRWCVEDMKKRAAT